MSYVSRQAPNFTSRIPLIFTFHLPDDKEEQDTEISDLTRHVFESNSDCAQLNDEVSNLQNKLQSVEKSTSLLHDQLKTKTTECVDLADSLSSTTDNLTASQLTVTELQNQLDQVYI